MIKNILRRLKNAKPLKAFPFLLKKEGQRELFHFTFASHLGTCLIIVLLLFIIANGLYAQEDEQPTQRDPKQVLTGIKNELERVLKDNIIPFWYPQTIDKENGGYNLNHDIKGKWLGPSDKYIVTQARMVWFFSHLARSKYGTKEHLESA
ncbi:MAG: hypothetical protein ACPL7B_01375, partial [Candidatus Poribacteria bacterium]